MRICDVEEIFTNKHCAMGWHQNSRILINCNRW